MSGPGAPPDEGHRFRFEATSGEVEGPAGRTRLAPQPASLLLLLLERRGEVVGRGEIKDRLWPGGGVDVDQGIAFALREVRKGLEEAGCDPGIVETIPRRGYRLRGGAPPDDASWESSGPTSGASSSEADQPSVWRRPETVASVGVLVVLAAFASTLARWSADEPVVAVLEHGSDDPALAGLARDLGTTLTTVLTDSLRGVAGIVGPTGTASLGGANDVEGAREDLGACLLASGTISTVRADSVRVFTQMVRTADRVHAWASVDTVAVEEVVVRVVPSVLEGARAALSDC